MNELTIVYSAVTVTSILIIPLILLVLYSFYNDRKINLKVYKIIIIAGQFLIAGYVFNELLNYELGFKLLELIVMFHLILAGYFHIISLKGEKKKRRGLFRK